MNTISRHGVIWIGGHVPNLFRDECCKRHLLLFQGTEADINNMAHRARCLVIQYRGNPDSFTLLFEEASKDALNHGLTVVLVQSETVSRDEYYEVAAKLTTNSRDPVNRIRSFYQDWSGLAQYAASYQPGLGEDCSVRIEGIDADGETLILLRRAFNGLDRIYLKQIQAGKSGARVWVAYPKGDGARKRPLPYLVKKHVIEKIQAERSNFEGFIRNAIPFDRRPDISESRCVEGSTNALLVQDFIDQAQPFIDVLKTANCDQLLSSLFNGALRGCISNRRLENDYLSKVFSNLKVLKWSNDAWLYALHDVAEQAKKSNFSTLSVRNVEFYANALPRLDYYRSTIHGDLHVGNIFVASGTSNVILIDFGCTTTGPTVADFACLEVSLALHSDLDDQTISELYKYPLLTPEPQVWEHTCWLKSAIRRIRLTANEYEPLPKPYIFAVASFLLRYASYADNGSLVHRALIFSLAAQLFQRLAEEVKTDE